MVGPVRLRDLISKDTLRQALIEKQAPNSADEHTLIPVSPQRRRQSARKRLDERTRSVANRVLDDLGLSHRGHELLAVVGGRRCANNEVVVRLLNKAVTDVTGSRASASADSLEEAFGQLDKLADTVRDDLQSKRSQRRTSRPATTKE